MTSWRRNCTVLVWAVRFGIAYSPRRSKKKKAIVVRSAVARVKAELDGWYGMLPHVRWYQLEWQVGAEGPDLAFYSF
jgi:hypothetical protein